GFITEQIGMLEKAQPVLQKTVGFGQEKPETQTPATVNWTKELALFREIDLNKKALAGNYTQTSTALPDGRKLTYTRISDSKAPITFLEITLGSQQEVKPLRAIYEQENALFFNREERTLQTNKARRISAYQIAGVQKVLLFDSINYRVKSMLP